MSEQPQDPSAAPRSSLRQIKRARSAVRQSAPTWRMTASAVGNVERSATTAATGVVTSAIKPNSKHNCGSSGKQAVQVRCLVLQKEIQIRPRERQGELWRVGEELSS